MYVIDHKGYCPICEGNVRFTSKHQWLRDNLFCSECKSIPRERALMHVIKLYHPKYKLLKIHESSPGNRGVSPKLKNECINYSFSHFHPNVAPGEIEPNSKSRCENLEELTFDNDSFDLFISQDVMEHIFDPVKAFREIARVLKPGGAHIFTVPMVNKNAPTKPIASRDESGAITYHQEAEYHGNPINNKGSLVTMHWGYDIAEFIHQNAATPTTIIVLDNIDMGIRAEYIEVLLSRKHSAKV